METLHLDLTQDATRAHIEDEVLSLVSDKTGIQQTVDQAGIPEEHFHDVGVIDGVIDQLRGVSDKVKEDMRGVYNTLAHAESHVHGVPVDKTHFHEVGESSTFKEILTICLAIERLNPTQITATPVQLGRGKVKCAHGIMDIPAPATKAIIDRGIPMVEKRLDGELCTPTSAALIWHFVDKFDGDDRRHLLLTSQDIVKDLDPNVGYGIAFSGGVDSSLLLAACIRHGIDAKPYTVVSAFVPQEEIEEAREFAKALGTKAEEIPVDVLASEEVCANHWDRCYQCKLQVFGIIQEHMAAEGRTVLMDGTNATDDPDDRPGFKALKELSVRSPLREEGFTKADIRRVSGQMGLPTSTKAKFSCFATFIPTDTKITQERLDAVAREQGRK